MLKKIAADTTFNDEMNDHLGYEKIRQWWCFSR